MGKGKKRRKGSEGARKRKEKREGGEGKGEGREKGRGRKGVGRDTRHTNPSLLPVPLPAWSLKHVANLVLFGE